MATIGTNDFIMIAPLLLFTLKDDLGSIFLYDNNRVDGGICWHNARWNVKI